MSETAVKSAYATGAAQKYAYAGVYAIQTTPITDHEEDGVYATFLCEDNSETCWACSAEWFDEIEVALARLLERRMPRFEGADGHTYPRVVWMELGCSIRAVNVAMMKSEPRRELEIA